MWTIEHHAGRLVEVRIQRIADLEEVKHFWLRIEQAFLQVGPGLVVLCTDLKQAEIFSPLVADELLIRMRGDNSILDRNGFLLSSSATINLQIERMVRQAQSFSRKCFRNPEDLRRWLGEVLNSDERAALKRFLARYET